MIEVTETSTVHNVPASDPDFRVESQALEPVVLTASLEVFCTDGGITTQWHLVPQVASTDPVERTMDLMVATAKREAERHLKSSRARVNYGIALLNAGHVDLASEQFQIASRLDPSNVSALAHMARVRLLQDRTDEALALAETLREVAPRSALGPLLTASVSLLRRQFAIAEAALREATVIERRNPWPEYLMGLVFIGDRKGSDAISHLRAAARIQPRSAAVYHALGVAYGLQQGWVKSIRAFRTALALDPRRRESCIALGHVLLRHHSAGEALTVLSDWVADADNDPEAHELLAKIHHNTGNHKLAKSHLHVALRSMLASDDTRRDQARVENNIGVCWAHMGTQKNAAEWFSRSIQTEPSMLGYRNLAFTYRGLRNVELAFGAITQALANSPDDAETRLLASVIAKDLEHYNDAIAMLTALIEGGNAVAEAYSCLGVMLADNKHDYTAAAAVLAEARAHFPQNLPVANNLAYALAMGGRVASAREVLDSLPIEEINKSAYLMATSGLIRIWEGDFDEGKAFYAAAAKAASASGRGELGKIARQKMHLELARASLRNGDATAAAEHVKAGIRIQGKGSYDYDLRTIQGLLADGASPASIENRYDSD